MKNMRHWKTLKINFLLIFCTVYIGVSSQVTSEETRGVLLKINEWGSLKKIKRYLQSKMPNESIEWQVVSQSMQLVWVKPTSNDKEVLQLVKRHTDVSHCQYNHVLQKRSAPNDPYLNSQWYFKNDSGFSTIDILPVWDSTTSGTTLHDDTIVIAILDDGADILHQDLSTNIWQNLGEIDNNGVDDDGNGFTDDFLGWNTSTFNDQVDGVIYGFHGTRVAGVIGGIGDNSVGISGVMWNCKLLILKAIDSEAQAIQGYDYVLQNRRLYNESDGEKGAFIVATNISWGLPHTYPSQTPIWCLLYDSLGKYGILNTVASSNSNENIDVVGDIPTQCPSNSVIGVTSSGKSDQLLGSYGPVSVDIAAPGKDIYTTSKQDQYASSTGTSFAAPMVAGAIGILHSYGCEKFTSLYKTNPEQAMELLKEVLLKSVDQNASLGNIRSTGRLNVHKALQLLADSCENIYPCGLQIEQIIENESAFGAEDGSVELFSNGSPLPTSMSVSWSNGQSGSLANHLAPGYYHYTVTLPSGCQVKEHVDVRAYFCEMQVTADVQNVSDVDSADGEILITVQGGVQPFKYNWLHGEDSSWIVGLDTGLYQVVVRDSKNCVVEKRMYVNKPICLADLDILATDAEYNQSNGSASAVLLGTYYEPLEFLWSNGSPTENIDSLQGDQWYELWLTDSAECVYIQQVYVSNGPLGIDFGWQQMDSVYLYPNPATSFIRLSYPLGDLHQLSIYSMNGGLVDKIEYFNEWIPVDFYPSGTYILEITGRDVNHKQLITIR